MSLYRGIGIAANGIRRVGQAWAPNEATKRAAFAASHNFMHGKPKTAMTNGLNAAKHYVLDTKLSDHIIRAGTVVAADVGLHAAFGRRRRDR